MGRLQRNPPTSPRRANCHIGSDPELPNSGPKMGKRKVRYASIMRMIFVSLQSLAAISPDIPGVASATPNSTKVNTSSVVRIACTKRNDRQVKTPVRHPARQILSGGITCIRDSFEQFLP